MWTDPSSLLSGDEREYANTRPGLLGQVDSAFDNVGNWMSRSELIVYVFVRNLLITPGVDFYQKFIVASIKVFDQSKGRSVGCEIEQVIVETCEGSISSESVCEGGEIRTCRVY